MVENIYGELGAVYDDAWYDDQFRASLESARVYVPFLSGFLQPNSVLDVGCGRGAWLKAWRECGAKRVIGFDGNWNSYEKMLEPAIQFRQIDLNQNFELDEKVDLAMSLEVAEHLHPGTADQFVACLAQAADVVLFSAAISNQGGTNHLNERPPSYWAKLFKRIGYSTFDPFRAAFWNDGRICYWYRQNTFLYAKTESLCFEQFVDKGLAPLRDFTMMDCVHPVLLDKRSKQLREKNELTFRQHMTALPGSFRKAIKRRLTAAKNVEAGPTTR